MSLTKALQDKLHDLLARSEDFDRQMCRLQLEILELQRRNEYLTRENETLGAKNSSAIVPNTDVNLAEAIKKLNQMQKLCEDQTIAKDLAEKELAKEKQKRRLAQKERDSYSAAYEASLRHYDRWASHKLVRKEKNAVVDL